VEAGNFNNTPGAVLRCSAFEVDMVHAPWSVPSPAASALGVALHGAPQIPRGGGWSMGTAPVHRRGALRPSERLPGAAGAAGVERLGVA